MLWDIGIEVGAQRAHDRRVRGARWPPTSRSGRACSSTASSRASRALYRAIPAARFASAMDVARVLRGEGRSSSSSGTSSTTTPPTTSSPTSRRARAACATCRRCSGSRAPPGSAARWRELARAGLMTDAARRARCRGRSASSARCACGCTTSPGGARTGWCSTSRTRSRAQLGLADTPTRRASEQLMQRYYRAAKLVRQVNVDPAAEPARAAVSDRPREPRRRSTTTSRPSTSCSTSRDEDLFERRPAAMLDAFLTHAAPPAS